MQKQVYEAPDLTVYGNVESLTAGQSQFSPQNGFNHGSNISSKPHDGPRGDKDKKWGWGWPWGGWNWHW